MPLAPGRRLGPYEIVPAPELLEALPTERSYQDYLQLVPGVLPSPVSGNPAVRSGLNYREIGGEVGRSTDNRYFLEGIDVTDPTSGLASATVNPEILSEVGVITGGVSAQNRGAPGLVVNLVTRSGGNDLSGSITTFYQDEGLVEDDETGQRGDASILDLGATLGGPIHRDRAWFFASLRSIEEEEDVSTPPTMTEESIFLRTVTTDRVQAFAKATWSIGDAHHLSGIFANDPLERDGSTTPVRLNQRDLVTEEGGSRYSLDYSGLLAPQLLVRASFSEHDGELSRLAKSREPRNDIAFPAGTSPSIEMSTLGGFGSDFIDERDTRVARLSAELLVETGWGDHTLEAGLERNELRQSRDQRFVGDPAALWTSLTVDSLGRGLTLGDVQQEFGRFDFNPFNSADYFGLLETIEQSPDAQRYFDLLDTDRDGTISRSEMANNIVFDETAGNPNGQINYYRRLETAGARQITRSEGDAVFLQDTWQGRRWSVNAGVRVDQWSHYDTEGAEIFTSDWEVAPRLAVVWDPFGTGRHRISAFYGGRHAAPGTPRSGGHPLRRDLRAGDGPGRRGRALTPSGGSGGSSQRFRCTQPAFPRPRVVESEHTSH